MRYTKRDLRAADILAAILVGLGGLLLVVGIVRLAKTGEKREVATTAAEPPPRTPAKAAKGSLGPGYPEVILGAVFLTLGGALSLKVRALVRNRGRESSDYPGVPHANRDSPSEEEVSGH